MKKTLLMLACLGAVATVATAQTVTTTNPASLRTWGDQDNDGAIWSIGTVAALPFPACGVRTTVHGAGYVGGIDTFEIVAPRADANTEDDYIHDMITYATFSASALPAPGPNVAYYLDLSNMSNYGFGTQLEVSIVDYNRLNLVMANRGPFGGATANFSTVHNMLAGSSNNTTQVIGNSRVVPFAPVISSQSIRLDGGGSMRACIGATGQVRFLLPNNNGGWDDDCHQWDETTVDIGGGLFEAELLAAQSRANLTTCNVSCSPPGPGDRNRDCTNVISQPFGLAIKAGGALDNRVQQWMSVESPIVGFGPDNIVVLGGDPTEPSSIKIRAVGP